MIQRNCIYKQLKYLTYTLEVFLFQALHSTESLIEFYKYFQKYLVIRTQMFPYHQYPFIPVNFVYYPPPNQFYYMPVDPNDSISQIKEPIFQCKNQALISNQSLQVQKQSCHNEVSPLIESCSAFSQTKIKKFRNKAKGTSSKQKVTHATKLNTRNILPNSIHQILTYVRKENKSGKMIQKVFKALKSQNNWSISRYYLYQKTIKDRTNYYLKENELQMLSQIQNPYSDIYPLEEQQFYMKISRILAFHYLNRESIPVFLTSNRINTKLRIEHIKNRRYLANKITQIMGQRR